MTLPEELSGLNPELVEARLRLCNSGCCEYMHSQEYAQEIEQETFEQLVRQNYIAIEPRPHTGTFAQTRKSCSLTYRGFMLFQQLDERREKGVADCGLWIEG